MAMCSRCGRVWREPPGEEGDHPCECAECRYEGGWTRDDEEEEEWPDINEEETDE